MIHSVPPPNYCMISTGLVHVILQLRHEDYSDELSVGFHKQSMNKQIVTDHFIQELAILGNVLIDDTS